MALSCSHYFHQDDGASDVVAAYHVNAAGSDVHDSHGVLLESEPDEADVVHERRVPGAKP